MNTILFALWFFLPAGLANSSPVFANKIPFLNHLDAPLDFGKSWRGKRILGPNKRWRGLICGVLVATMTLWLQQYLYSHTGWAQTISQDVVYTDLPVLILGPLFGLGALLLGDAGESFFKRQMNIPSGESWFPFDQLDYIVGALLASSLVVVLSLEQYTAIIVVWFCAHIIFTYIGYLLGMRDAKI